ncbi:SET domain containing protein [Strigomonas culicis]|uniref:SET domain containing protein n=1 Tax=Strigomonas culicis TaxID=28005 RepID=S9W1B3_9TRYP|nr:SET domain containing protein [Strigomonas culicis]|eukprot:EPY33146.1 SET domain containing protein [Strigomonas culicis]
MEITAADVLWWEQKLEASDSAAVKRFYLSFTEDPATRAAAGGDAWCLAPALGQPWELGRLLFLARVVAADERTLWECLGPRLREVFDHRVDGWNEQSAVKVVHQFLTDGVDAAARPVVAALQETLHAHTADHVKPLPDTPAVGGAPAAARDELDGAVGITDMQRGNDYSEGSIVCRRPLPPFATLLRLPRDRLFCVASVRQHSALGRAVAHCAALASLRENEEAFLVLALLYERDVAGAASHWSALLQTCPPGYPTVPGFWPLSDLAELEGVDILDEVLQRRAQLDDFQAQLGALLPLLLPALRAAGGPADLTLERLAAVFATAPLQWARATFDSRAFRLNVDGQVVLALVPVADMINHQNRSDVLTRRVEPNGGDFVLEVGAALTDRDVGRELWMSYGPLQNWELLQYYGFVLPDNEHDKLPFPLGVDALAESDDVWDRRRWQIISHYHLYDAGRCWIARSGVPSAALRALLRVLVAQAEEFDGMERDGPFAQLSPATEGTVRETLRQTVACVMDLFSTTLEEDEEALLEMDETGTAAADDSSQTNMRLCLELRSRPERIALAC